MRLLLITSSFPRGRIMGGLFLPDLIDALIERGCSVHVLTQNCAAPETEHITVKPGYELTLFGWPGGATPLVSVLKQGPRGLWRAAQYMRNGIRTGVRVAREWKAERIMAEWLIPGGAIARSISRRTGIPFAARALGSDVMLAARNPLLRVALRRVARSADVLFANSDELCRRTSALAGGRPCHFASTVRSLGMERSGFQFVRDGAFTLACLGRLHRVKGQDVLLEALARLPSDFPPFRCYMAGAGEEEERIAQQIERLGLRGRAIVTGRLLDGDLRELLEFSDVVVIPSRSESIPLVLREAIEAGRAVIATDVGDMGNFVRKYQLGAVIAPENPAALAGVIKAFARAPHKLDTGLAAEFKALFSVDAAADTILRELSRA